MYLVHTDDEVTAALEELPPPVSLVIADLRAALAVSPWSVAPSINPDREDAEVRCHVFEIAEGEGMVWYQITESLGRVDLLRLSWFGPV